LVLLQRKKFKSRFESQLIWLNFSWSSAHLPPKC